MSEGRSLVVAHLYPELLNLYGDGGNVMCLERRLAWRGIHAEVRAVHVGERASFADVDIAFVGGGSDREQRIVCESLLLQRAELAAFAEDGGVILAICGGYQLLGDSYMMGEERIAGLGILDAHTDRGETRLIGNIVVDSPLASTPVVGYENHGGRTRLGPSVEAFGRVLAGYGNDGETGMEGCLWKNVLGTYCHGPLLPKNPEIADWLLGRALERRFGDATLASLDDHVELAANEAMRRRLLA